jgi:hypothetical protein
VVVTRKPHGFTLDEDEVDAFGGGIEEFGSAGDLLGVRKEASV